MHVDFGGQQFALNDRKEAKEKQCASKLLILQIIFQEEIFSTFFYFWLSFKVQRTAKITHTWYTEGGRELLESEVSPLIPHCKLAGQPTLFSH